MKSLHSMLQCSREELAEYLSHEHDDPLNHPNFTTLLLIFLEEPFLTAFYLGGTFKQLARLGFDIGDPNIIAVFNDNWMTAWDKICFAGFKPDEELEALAMKRLTEKQVELYKAYHEPGFFKMYDEIRKRKAIPKD